LESLRRLCLRAWLHLFFLRLLQMIRLRLLGWSFYSGSSRCWLGISRREELRRSIPWLLCVRTELSTLTCSQSTKAKLHGNRAELLKRVCGYEDGYATNCSIDKHIMKLRHKLEIDPSGPTHFRTVPRLGYKFTF
jgi:hypothetical protein